MRAQLQELAYDIELGEVDTLSLVCARIHDILAAQPAVSVKAGWVCKDRVGLWWCEHEPELLADGKWITTGSLYLSKRVFTDPWPDKPNGGPDCLREVKP